jgi:hypothetical protein
VDLREAAGTLGVHYQTAHAGLRDGTLPARKAGPGGSPEPASPSTRCTRAG